MLFGGHDILDLAEIPRDRPRLQRLINTARRARRRARLVRWAALNIAAWSLYIALGAPGFYPEPPAAAAAPATAPLYLPVVIR